MFQEGGQPQEQQQQVFEAIAQMLQQMSPEDVVKTLMENNMSQEQAVQAVQQVMQLMQEQAQGQPQAPEQMQEAPQQEAPDMEQMVQMAYGGTAKLIKKAYGGNTDFNTKDSRSYANDSLAYFANALKKNNALAFLTEANQAVRSGLPKADNGLFITQALKDLGHTQEEYDSKADVKNIVDAYVKELEAASPKKETKTTPASTTTVPTITPGTQAYWDGTKYVPYTAPQGFNPYSQGFNPYGYGYNQLPMFQNPNPFRQLFSTYGTKTKVKGFNVPPGFNIAGFLSTVVGPDGKLAAGATGKVGDKEYTLSNITPFTEKKGLLGLRRKKGVRFEIDWSNPTEVAKAINDPNVQTELSEKELDEKKVGPDGQTQPVGNNQTQPTVNNTQPVGNNYTDDDIIKAVQNPNMPLTNDEQAMLNVLLQNKKIANDYTPAQLQQITAGIGSKPLGRYDYNPITGENKFIESYSPDELERLQREKLKDIDFLAENQRKMLYAANPRMFQEGFSSEPYVRPTNEFIDSPSFNEIIQTQGNGNYHKALQQSNKQEAWKNQGMKNNFWGTPVFPDGTKAVYDENQQLFIPKKEFGGPIAQWGLEVTEGKGFNASPEQWANASIYGADWLARQAENMRRYKADQERLAATQDTVNLYGSQGYDTMDQGLYDQWGNFIPNKVNNQVLNPTEVGYSTLNRIYAEGGEYDLTDEEIAQLKAAGYTIKMQ